MKLVFIINGQDTPFTFRGKPAMVEVVTKVLRKSGNHLRPANEWELRDTRGALLEKWRTADELGLKSGDRFFLSLRVGAGGDQEALCREYLKQHFDECVPGMKCGATTTGCRPGTCMHRRTVRNADGSYWMKPLPGTPHGTFDLTLTGFTSIHLTTGERNT